MPGGAVNVVAGLVGVDHAPQHRFLTEAVDAVVDPLDMHGPLIRDQRVVVVAFGFKQARHASQGFADTGVVVAVQGLLGIDLLEIGGEQLVGGGVRAGVVFYDFVRHLEAAGVLAGGVRGSIARTGEEGIYQRQAHPQAQGRPHPPRGQAAIMDANC